MGGWAIVQITPQGRPGPDPAVIEKVAEQSTQILCVMSPASEGSGLSVVLRSSLMQFFYFKAIALIIAGELLLMTGFPTPFFHIIDTLFLPFAVISKPNA